MKQDHIKEVLDWEAFKDYDEQNKQDLTKVLQSSEITLAQMNVLFGEGLGQGILIDLVDESKNNDKAACQLYKVINNIKESPDGSHPPIPIIQTIIGTLGPYTESMAVQVQEFIRHYIEHKEGRILKPQDVSMTQIGFFQSSLTDYRVQISQLLIAENLFSLATSSAIRRSLNALRSYFRNNSPEELLLNILQQLQSQQLLNQTTFDQLLSNYGPGIWQGIKNLADCSLLNLENFNHLIQHPSIAYDFSFSLGYLNQHQLATSANKISLTDAMLASKSGKLKQCLHLLDESNCLNQENLEYIIANKENIDEISTAFLVMKVYKLLSAENIQTFKDYAKEAENLKQISSQLDQMSGEDMTQEDFNRIVVPSSLQSPRF